VIVLDTTVLVYATGAAHRFREPCRRIVASVARGQIEASTTVEVLQEFVHVRARRRSRAEAVELGAAYADLLAPLLPVTTAELQVGLRLFLDLEGLRAFDAVLAAAAREAHAEALVSADAAFASVPGLVHVVPDDAGVERLLAG
jgi:predicted nucleic acid-binding protein